MTAERIAWRQSYHPGQGAGLRAQVLGRIEALEERERGRRDLLSELVPLLERHGHDTQDVRAALGG